MMLTRLPLIACTSFYLFVSSPPAAHAQEPDDEAESDEVPPAAEPVDEAPTEQAAPEAAPPEQAPAPAAPIEEVPAEAEAAPPPPPPPPYSLPFALRPTGVANIVRSDTALGLYEDPASGESGSTLVSLLLASYKVTDELAPLIRVGVVSHSPPDPAPSGFGFLNPVLGLTYAPKLGPNLRLAPFFGVALPLGSGGGESPEPEQVAARNAGIPVRSAMDNAMFAVNDLVLFPGIGFAYVADGFTAQVEVTVLQLTRLRGNDTVQPDSSRTNFTSGVHLGYFFVPQFSFGVELRHQRWLSTPVAVEANDALRDNTTFAFGPRVHLKLSDTMWLRPAIAFAMPLDEPMTNADYKIIQLDLPFSY